MNKNTNSDKNNKYIDYLPKNRYKKETPLAVSPKLLRALLIIFYFVLIFVFVYVGMFFTGHDVFKAKARNYNLNLEEKIYLNNFYMSPNVEWISNNDNIKIENNVITAIKPGTVYIYAKEDGKVVKDLTLNVLTGEEEMSIDNHALFLNVNDNSQITVTKNYKNSNKKKVEVDDDDNQDNLNTSNEIIEEYNYSSDIEDSDISGDEDKIDDNIFLDHAVEDIVEADEEELMEMDEADKREVTDLDVVEDSNYGDYDDDSQDDLETDTVDTSLIVDDVDKDVVFTYESSDEEVAVVDKNGVITTKKAGTATITVTDEYGNKDYTVVTVNGDKILIDVDNYTMLVNERLNINYVLNSSNYNVSDIVWSSDNEDVVTVDNSGCVSSVGVGDAKISVKVGDFEKKISVSVVDDEVLPTDLLVSTDAMTLTVGESKVFDVVVKPDNVTDSVLNLITEDSNIAVVEDGKIIGKNIGSTNVCAITSNGIKKCIVLNVVVNELSIERVELLFEDEKIEDLDSKMNLSMNKTVSVKNKNYLTSLYDEENDEEFTGEVEMKIGEKKKAIIKVTPDKVIDKSVKVESNGDYLKLDVKDGVVVIEAIKVGRSKIIVKPKNGGKKSTYYVNVNSDIEGMNLNKTKLELFVNSSDVLKVGFVPSKIYDSSVIWKSLDTNIVDVDKSGKVIAKKVGKTRIKVKSKVDSGMVKYVDIVVHKQPTMWVNGVAQVYHLTTSGYYGEARRLVQKIQNGEIKYKKNKYKQIIDREQDASQSILIKSSDGKLALLDTASNKGGICSYIIEQVYTFAKEGRALDNNKVVLDYLILSHYHNDHVGCAKTIISSSKIKINTIITKKVVDIDGSVPEIKFYNEIKNLANSRGIKFKDSNNYKEGDKIKFGNSNIYLYNVNDVFSNKKNLCNNSQIKSKPIKFYRFDKEKMKSSDKTGIRYLKLKNNKYVVYNIKEKKVEYINYNEKKNSTYEKKYYFAVEHSSGLCSSNANSIALLVEFPVNGGSKFAYFPSDLENNGYSFNGDEYKDTKVYGTGTTYFYNIKNDKISVDDKSRINVASEYLVAKRISNKLKDRKSDIIIYQSSHHGHNDDPSALNLLGFINRLDLYVIKSGLNRDGNFSSDVRSNDNLKNAKVFYTTNKLDDPYEDKDNTQLIRSKKNSLVILNIKSNGEVIANRELD